MSDEQQSTWIDRIARFAGRLGMNETRVRWKLMRWRDSRGEASERAKLAAAHVTYEHAVCGECGRILPRGTKQCPTCGAQLSPRWVQMLRRVGLHAPVPTSVSTLIGVMILVAFVRQVAASHSILGFPIEDLVKLGAQWTPAETQGGQWWRLGTAVLLHGGLLHVVFNLIALAQIGPPNERVFGPGRVLLFFVVMGIAANLPTVLLGRETVSIGASGAILGLAGLVAGWGQREGTTQGRAVRNAMLQWLLYTTLLGLALHVDHFAHFAGFTTGFVLGFASHGVRERRGALDATLGVIGFVLMAALLVLILFPPDYQWVAPWAR